RLHALEVLRLGPDHKQAFAALGMPGKAADGGIYRTETATACFLMQPIRRLGLDGRQVHDQRAGLGMIENAARAHYDLGHLLAGWQHRDDDGALACKIRDVLRRRRSELNERLDRLRPDIVNDKLETLPHAVGRHAAAHRTESDKSDSFVS